MTPIECLGRVVVGGTDVDGDYRNTTFQVSPHEPVQCEDYTHLTSVTPHDPFATRTRARPPRLVAREVGVVHKRDWVIH